MMPKPIQHGFALLCVPMGKRDNIYVHLEICLRQASVETRSSQRQNGVKPELHHRLAHCKHDKICRYVCREILILSSHQKWHFFSISHFEKERYLLFIFAINSSSFLSASLSFLLFFFFFKLQSSNVV